MESFLQAILGLTGGVITSDGEIVDGTNAVKTLLHDVYIRGLTNEEQDAIFAEVAELAFDKVTTDLGKVDLKDLMSVIGTGVSDGRLKLWMIDASEEALVQHLGCGGEVPTDETQPTLGIYFNDVTYSKIFWYLSTTTQVSAPTKNPDGSYSYTVTTTMHNNITKGEARDDSVYVTGYSGDKRAADDMLAFVYLYAPAGGSISDIKSTGYFAEAGEGDIPFAGEMEGQMIERPLNGLGVWFGKTQMLSGESTTVTYKVTTSPKAATDELAIRQTPTLQSIAGW